MFVDDTIFEVTGTEPLDSGFSSRCYATFPKLNRGLTSLQDSNQIHNVKDIKKNMSREKGWFECGVVLLLPEGFELALDHISPEIKETLSFQTYSKKIFL